MKRIILIFLSITIVSMGIISHNDVLAEQVKIAEQRMTFDPAGIPHITGIVENSGNTAAGIVHVIAHLFDEHGNSLPTYETTTVIRTLMPGYITPFDIPINDRNVAKRIAHYTLDLDWKPGTLKPNSLKFVDTKAFIWSHIDPITKQYRNPHEDSCTGKCFSSEKEHGLHAHSEISGLVENDGVTTRNVKIAVIWYDERGQFYSFDQQYVSDTLSPEETGRFVVMTHPAMGYYYLTAESEDYVGILMNDGERMFRIYDANKANPNPLGVDTIGMTDIVVSSGQKEIGRILLESQPVIPHSTSYSGELTQNFVQGGIQYTAKIITHSDKLFNFNYDESSKTFAFTVQRSSNKTLDPIHVELILPKKFNAFSSSDHFQATLDGVPLGGRMFLIDSFSYPDNVAFHYIISNSELTELLKQNPQDYTTDNFIFTLRVTGDDTISARVGEPLEFTSLLSNNIDTKQHLVFVLQIKNSTKTMLSFIQGDILSRDSINASFSWMPTKKGVYSMKIFLWESLEYHGTMSSNFAEATLLVSD